MHTHEKLTKSKTDIHTQIQHLMGPTLSEIIMKIECARKLKTDHLFYVALLLYTFPSDV